MRLQWCGLASRAGWAGHTILITVNTPYFPGFQASRNPTPVMNLPNRRFLEVVSDVACDRVTRGVWRRPGGDFSGCRREHVISAFGSRQTRRTAETDRLIIIPGEVCGLARLSRLGAMGAGEQCDNRY
jgi:hypothetical protein